MKRLIAMLGLVLVGIAGFGAGPAAAAICPTTVNTNTDCGYILTVNPDGSVTGALVPNANPYDGSDDALIGLVNDSSSTFSSPIVLTGSGNGGGIFGFDGDGICTYTNAAYCASTQYGYEGPQNTFSNISADTTSGEIDLTSGLAPGATTYFSLEGSPASISGGSGPVITVPGGGGAGGTTVPEPISLALLGTGLFGLAAARQRRSS